MGESGEKQVTVQLTISPRWWLGPALLASMLALKLGLIRDKASAEHWGGRITAEERMGKWLADYAFRFGAR